MIVLNLNGLAAKFQSRGYCLNWLSHQGVNSSQEKLISGEILEIFRAANGQILNIQIAEVDSTDDNMKIENYLNSLPPKI